MIVGRLRKAAWTELGHAAGEGLPIECQGNAQAHSCWTCRSAPEPNIRAAHDPLQLIIDISELGVVGYSAGDWLRDHHRINLHICDHRRISAQLTYADDEQTTQTLIEALRDLADHVGDRELRPAGQVYIPPPNELRLELAELPRDAFFGRTEQVPAKRAAGRVVAEMLTPYPPGIPVALPGERLTEPVLDYLRTGVAAGMVVPDAVDTGLNSVRVLRES